jgi:hypothetical protein
MIEVPRKCITPRFISYSRRRTEDASVCVTYPDSWKPAEHNRALATSPRTITIMPYFVYLRYSLLDKARELPRTSVAYTHVFAVAGSRMKNFLALRP